MRLFLAIELPQTVRDHLGAVQQIIAGLASCAALTAIANLHLTVKFLGEVSDAKFDSLIDSLGKIGRPGAIGLTAVGLECFGGGNSIRVIGAALGGDLRAGRIAPVAGAAMSVSEYTVGGPGVSAACDFGSKP